MTIISVFEMLIDKTHKRRYIDYMKTLTITKARANLSALLEKAKRGEDIGISFLATRSSPCGPVTVSSG